MVSVGLGSADPMIGLVITILILLVTWQSWRTVSAAQPRPDA